MSERIRTLCSLLFKVNFFADVGCDHGYCAEYMLKNGLCQRALVTDVSPSCLAKAEKLLLKYRREGRCESLCTDGLSGVPQAVDLVLIAGMGGMETVKILQKGFIPKSFVFQPMHDARFLREFLLSRGAALTRDFTFRAEGKYYDAIVGTACGKTEAYSEAELHFGRENVQKRGADFLSFLREEIGKTREYLSRNLKEESRRALIKRLSLEEGVLSGEIK